MHKDFAEWYRSAGITPNGEILPKRWAAIQEYQPGRDEIVSLAQLFYRLGKPSEEFLNKFRTSFQNVDPAFPMRDNDQELVVLAGAQLVATIESGPINLADLAALSLVTGAAQNMRGSPAVADIPEIAVTYLSKRAVARAANGDGNSNSANELLFDGLTELGTPYDGLPKEFERLQRELSVVSEESNMLWWLFSEHSRDLNEPWKKQSGVPSVALMVGKELADLTRVIPGPISARAFLDRAIRSIKSKPPEAVLVVDAINGVAPEWRQRYVAEGCPTSIQGLMPISHGLKISLAAPENNAWFSAFTHETGIRPESKLPPNVLAYQLYVEAIFSRAWKTLR